jgi:transposase
LDLSKKQKEIINDWLDIYAQMYNISIEYIKKNILNDKKVLNFQYLRGTLYNEKSELINKSTMKVHDIDGAIKLACTNYKSALSNYKNGNIKNFRIRSWNKNKENKILDLEKANFNNNTIRKSILGNVKGYYNGQAYNFNDVKCDSKILKNKIGEYILLVPELLKNCEQKKTNNIMVADLGVRIFSTCMTKNQTIEIGTNASKEILKHLKRKDKIMNNKNIEKKIKRKNEKLINKKISNIVDELQWKTINTMLNFADTIIIGDIHSKSIVDSNKKHQLPKIIKRVILALNMDKFKKRLEYKCAHKKKELCKINEWLTSKMCCNCGCINENLGSKKIFECLECKIKIDRDINGARNIYIKSIL